MKANRHYVFYSFSLFLTGVLKYLYQTRGAVFFDWLLFPVQLLVEIFTGIDFYKGQEGYLSVKCGVIIDKSCSGLNYLNILLIVTTISLVAKDISWKKNSLQWILGLFLSYGSLIVINSFRIALAIWSLRLKDFFPFIAEIPHLHMSVNILSLSIFLFLYIHGLSCLKKKEVFYETKRPD